MSAKIANSRGDVNCRYVNRVGKKPHPLYSSIYSAAVIVYIYK